MKMSRLDHADRHGARGQTLPIFAIGLVALLAITALVVDVGFMFMIRRHEQNAADPGALAAARYIPSGNRAQMWSAACSYALRNGFQPARTDNGAACDPSGVVDDSTLTVNWPPSPSAGAYAGSPGYVEVIVARPHRSLFAGVLGLPAFTVSTGAVAAYDEGTGGSSSLVSLSPKDCEGEAAAKINGGGGDGGIYIFPAAGVTDPGGYIQVNSSCGAPTSSVDDTCTGSQAGFILNGGAEVHAPALFVQGACGQTGGSGTIDIDSIDEGASYVGDPLSLVRPPDPGDLVTRDCPDVAAGQSGTPSNPKSCRLKADATLSPGTYYGGWDITKPGTTITLEPGIYIIAGGGIKQNGGSLTSATGRVLIYSTDAPLFRATCLAGGGSPAQCQDDIVLNGSGALNLRGLDRDTACPPYSGPSGCPYGGMLVWQDGMGSGAHTGRADIDIGGGASLNIEGTIYTAGGHVDVLGNGVSTGCTPDTEGNTNCAAVQIIADTFQVGGAAVLEMPYDPDDFYHLTLKGLVR
ncbi:MAG: pilus assembly protein TadG-related protein [Candidatus Limnocylindrales bacterium]